MADEQDVGVRIYDASKITRGSIVRHVDDGELYRVIEVWGVGGVDIGNNNRHLLGISPSMLEYVGPDTISSTALFERKHKEKLARKAEKEMNEAASGKKDPRDAFEGLDFDPATGECYPTYTSRGHKNLSTTHTKVGDSWISHSPAPLVVPKKHVVDLGGLIQEEVKALKKDERKPLQYPPGQQVRRKSETQTDEQEEPAEPLPKREGTW